MSTTSGTLIGHVIDVRGDGLTANLLADEQDAAPKVTVGDEDVLVGQLGSYVSVRQGSVRILCVISRVSEQEKLADANTASPDAPTVTYAQRAISLIPIGSVSADGEFERGVSSYPTTGAEVHVVAGNELDTLFSKFRSLGYVVGSLSSQPAVRFCLEPSRLFGRHFAILGQTGAGKSWAVASLIQQALAVMPKAHIIILDLHGEYSWQKADGTRGAAFKDEHFRYVDAKQLEMPYWLMTYAELCDLLIDHSEREAANQTAFFRDTVFELKQAEKDPLKLDRVTIDTPVFFSLDELVRRVSEKNTERSLNPETKRMNSGPLYGTFDRFLIRLQSKLNDVRYDFLLKPAKRKTSASLSELLRDFVGLGDPKRPVTVIDLSTVPFDVRPTVAAQIGRLAFEFNFWNPQYREFPLLLVCEEAHAYVTREHNSQFAGARKSMERIAKEGRKYGVGLGVVSQRPHELSETVLAQCGTFLCLRITNPDDQAYVRSLVPEAERGLVDILAGLGRGECLALGEAVPLPTRFQFTKPSPVPNSDDIDFYNKWKAGPDDINVEDIVDRWRRQRR
jgi:DNA helicase HerA-like ATPase